MHDKEAEMRYIQCRFLDENGVPKGRDYTYKTDCAVSVGDFVFALTPGGEEKKIIVSSTTVDESVYAAFKDKIKTVFTKPTEKAAQEVNG